MTVDAAGECRSEGPRTRSLFLTPRALANALRAGKELADNDFDQFLPARYQDACRDATPLAVAIRATEWLTEGKGVRVLDTGAGIGKFAIIGALTTNAFFTGVEQHLPLLRAARGIALRLGAKRVTLVQGTVADMELCAFDAIYLFDPPHDSDGATKAQLSRTRLTWRKLPDARKGTKIVTYRGGADPPGCHMVLTETASEGRLTLFVKD